MKPTRGTSKEDMYSDCTCHTNAYMSSNTYTIMW